MMDQKMYMTLNSKFSGIRVIDGTLIPVEWKIQADLHSTSDSTRSSDEGAVVYQKMLFWLAELLDNVIVVDIDDEFAELFHENINNNVMTVPGDPSDDLLCKILVDKLSVIGKEAGITVLGLAITGSDINLTYHFSDPEGDTGLPDISYAGESAKKHYKTPWWNRPTSDVNDFPPEDEEDTADGKILNIRPKEDILAQFGNQVARNMLSPTKSEEKESNATIIEPEWKKQKK